MKSGFVSLVGRPNVGKSTLLNTIIGQKISIVTPKSQTTRDSILGIYNDDDSQIIFIDTPGIHKAFNKLGEALDKISYSSIRGSDIALLIVDASHQINEGDDIIMNLKFDMPLIIAFNKIDLTNINLITDLKTKYHEKFPSAKLIEISCLDKFGIDDLLKLIKDMLEEGPQYYDVNEVTTQDLKFRIQEIVREQMLKLLKEEVPHGALILCEEINYSSNTYDVFCKIIIERESQKGIVIGKNGTMIKRIGTYARQDIEHILGKHVRLQLKVQLVENWRNSSSFLAKAGYKIK